MRWELLDRYLTDSCDAEERDEVDRWLAESAGHRRVLEQIAEALEQAPPEALNAVRSQLEQELGLERGSRGSPYQPEATAKKRAKTSPGRAVKAPAEGTKKRAKSQKRAKHSAKRTRKKPSRRGKKRH